MSVQRTLFLEITVEYLTSHNVEVKWIIDQDDSNTENLFQFIETITVKGLATNKLYIFNIFNESDLQYEFKTEDDTLLKFIFEVNWKKDTNFKHIEKEITADPYLTICEEIEF
ncbi:hypothetical protein ABK040_001274 [Willaertia magna]